MILCYWALRLRFSLFNIDCFKYLFIKVFNTFRQTILNGQYGFSLSWCDVKKKYYMKQIILIGIIALITGCTQTEYNYRVVNSILECYYQNHKDNGILVKNTIDKVENILIKHKVLEDKTGNSYIKTIEQIRDHNDLTINNPDLLTDIKSVDNIPSNVFCNNTSYTSSLDSVSQVHSKYRHVIGIFDSIRTKGDISPTLIAEEVLKVFSAKDFENDYYRTLSLVMFSNMIKMNDNKSTMTRKLPPIPKKESEEIEAQNIFEILINEEDHIIVDGVPIDISELNGLVKNFLLETSDKTEIDLPLIGNQKTSKGIIYLRNDKGAYYEQYKAIRNELIKTYKEIREVYSLEFFNLNFNSLKKEQQKVITDLVPQRIFERE